MIEYGITPETVHLTADLVSLLAIGYLGFSAGQRGAIKYRDNKECQMDCPLAEHCGGRNDKLNVHHVRPQRWLTDHGFDPDYAENGITLCETFHQNEIHGVPQHEINRRVRMRVPYWNTKHDSLLAERAEENTIRAEEERKWKFPDKPKTKKHNKLYKRYK